MTKQSTFDTDPIKLDNSSINHIHYHPLISPKKTKTGHGEGPRDRPKISFKITKTTTELGAHRGRKIQSR